MTKWFLRLICSAVVAAAPCADAQAIVDNGIDDRIEALNAVFMSRADLRGDSLFIARCRLPGAGATTGLPKGIDARFERLMVRPDAALAPDPADCGVSGFADPKTFVLWLQDLTEVTKASVIGIVLPYRAKQFEIVFQVLKGPSYREYERYVVEPAGMQPVKGGAGMQYAGWRVVEYHFAGADFHWGDNAGHGSGVRRP